MKNLLLAITLLATVNAGAVTVTINETTNPILDSTFLDYGQYHSDTATELDWLEFGSLVGAGITFGHSLNSAEAAYNPQGWRLATYTEVYGLFDMFFPTFDGGTDGKMTILDTGGTGADPLIQSRNSWLFGFGTDAVETSGGTITIDKSTIYSTGLFLDENNDVSILGLKIDTNPLLTTLYGPTFQGPSLTLDSAYSNMGVFMVRDTTVVPVPAAVWLFASGLLGLVAVARRKAQM